MSTVAVTNDEATLVVTSRTLGVFHVLIDLEDIGRAAEHQWYVHKERSGLLCFGVNIYRPEGEQSGMLLHRFLLDAAAGMTARECVLSPNM